MDNLMSLISKAKRSMDRYVLDEMNKRGYGELAISHGDILVNFFSKDVMNYKELSKRINKTPQTMTTLIRKLEKEGYIYIEVDPEDKRNKLVRLAEKGKEFLPVLEEISKNLYDLQYIGFNDEEQKVIKKLLPKLIKNFEE